MFFRSSGRNDPDAFPTFRISHMDKDTVAHPDQVNTLFCVVLASIESFDGKWVPEDPDRLVELKAMLAPVEGGFVLIPLEFQSCYYGYPVSSNRSIKGR
jgi:hypothetical protein